MCKMTGMNILDLSEICSSDSVERKMFVHDMDIAMLTCWNYKEERYSFLTTEKINKLWRMICRRNECK